MLDASTWEVIDWPSSQRPLLVVIVDTEAEFDWSGPSRRAVGVRSARHQEKAQRIFDRYGVRPTFVLDYPVSSTPDGFVPIRDILKDGRCEIGAHLQPWDTPPLGEQTDDRNSYPGNLPPELERAKLAVLTEVIEQNLGVRPRIYKAGRYGVGAATAATLRALGYEIDVSVLPGTSLAAQGGPDFSRCVAGPYWFGPPPRLLEIPLTIGFTGLLAHCGQAIHRRLAGPRAEAWHAPGVLARLGLLERITLTPEGVTFGEQRRLARAMLRRGYRIFSLTYHSPSLLPGSTPYVRSEAELRKFLDCIERFLDFFMGDLGGGTATPIEVKATALRATSTQCPNR